MRFILVGTLPLLAIGCNATPQYPWDRPGSWQATGANAYNLQAMVANPRDLVSGQAASTDRGDAGAFAVNRLYLDCRRALLRESSSNIGQDQQGQSQPASDCNQGGRPAGAATTFALPAGTPVLVAAPQQASPTAAAPAP